ncbi:hypothetical protein Q7C36_002092 [Tachysurus vachellii]|uniref:Uncharacterized protein n=1 Tax=Tachysurus vachellii TaxID=175792 RepID=A0AA88NTX5_TACVA|nr:hypothetical protein Q7C36_002092 [Tachysurus vachellii]
MLLDSSCLVDLVGNQNDLTHRPQSSKKQPGKGHNVSQLHGVSWPDIAIGFFHRDADFYRPLTETPQRGKDGRRSKTLRVLCEGCVS